MPDVQVENFLLNTSNDQSSGIWKVTRAQKTAGWRYKASSDGTTKDTTGNPNNDKWGGGVSTGNTGGGGFTIGTPTTTAYGGRSTISGLSGGAFSATSPGHFLKIVGAANGANNGTWLITNFISATSVTIENPNAIAETVGIGGGQSYTELSALTDTFPALAAGAWWLGQGPSTMKIAIDGTLPTGTFIRGENVTQATSGATGEFLGVVTDTVTNAGYLVIAPRLSGTGGGPRGWSSDTITGARSGATITPTAATAIEFVREIVYWRSTTTAGHIYYQCIDQSAEAGPNSNGAGRFSLMTGTATTVICPGGAATNSPTTNGFPLFGSYVPLGQGGSGAVATGALLWFNSGFAINAGKCQFLVTNCIEDTGISADGTMTVAGGSPPTTNQYVGWGFHRVDDQEDGDVEPYVWYMYDTRGSNNRTRLLGNQIQSASGDVWNTPFVITNGGTPFLSWRRRGYQVGGVANGDSWIELQAFVIGTTSSIFANNNTGNPEKVACTITTTTMREPIFTACYTILNNVPQKIRKGVLRWWYIVQGNSGNDTYDTKQWIQMSSTAFPIVVGPADGTTVPVNQ